MQIQLEDIRRRQKYLEYVATQLRAGEDYPLQGGSASDFAQPSGEISEEKTQEITRSLRIFEESVRGPMKSLVASADRQMAVYQAQQQAFYDQIVWLELLGFGSVIVMLTAQFYGLLMPVTQDLRRLQAGTERIALNSRQGDDAANGVSPEVLVSNGDELKALAAVFNQMSDRLRASYQDLELRVAQRTASLHRANQSLVTEVSDRLEAENSLKQALAKLKQTQLQLLQTEKMSSLGQLVAGVAHEINNPVSFIRGNLEPARDYMNALLGLIESYQDECPKASAELITAAEQADLAFIRADFPRLPCSMQTGAERISEIVRSLQTFSHLDESETKAVDIHQGIDSAVFLIAAQLKATAHRPAIEVKRHYTDLPKIYGYPGQLNQVFMSILTNAIDALSPEQTAFSSICSKGVCSKGVCSKGALVSKCPAAAPTIEIATDKVVKDDAEFVRIRFTDNGVGISEAARCRLFEPFFTTKPVGSGIGLGLSMSYQIVSVNHKGKIICDSQLGKEATFTLEIPLNLEVPPCEFVEPAIRVAAMPGMLAP